MSEQDKHKTSNGGSNGDAPTEAGGESARDHLSVQDHIGQELRAMFDEVVAQPVPERLRKLLEQLAAKHPKK
jgi:Anti-sigma factor NepR